MVGMCADNFVSNNQMIENLDSISASTYYKHFSLHIVIRTLNFGESQGQGMLYRNELEDHSILQAFQ